MLKGCGRKLGPYDCCTVVCGDCLELMKALSGGCMDLVYADPPFNTGNKIGWRGRSYGPNGNDNHNQIDYAAFCERWFAEARRLAKRLLVTPGAGNIGLYPNAYWCCAIHKPSSPSFNRMGGFNCWEPLLVYDAGLIRLSRDVLEYDSCNLYRDGREKHPCPDNHKMVEFFLATWSNEGEIVLDPFLGSGTTAVAAKKLGRHFLGFEISPEYCKIAEERIALVEMQPTLFEKKPEQLQIPEVENA